MTTNDEQKLPEELIRPGRLDVQVEFGPLTGGDIDAYVTSLLVTFNGIGNIEMDYSSTQPIEHARLTSQIIEQVRKHLLTNGNG